MYELAQKEGYGKSYDDFITLLNTNEEAFNTMYGLAQKEGYAKPIDDFYTLMGVKKKDAASQQDSVLEVDSTVPTSGTAPQAQPQSGDAVSTETPVAGFETKITPGPMGLPLTEVVQTPEEPNFLTGTFGDMVNSIRS